MTLKSKADFGGYRNRHVFEIKKDDNVLTKENNYFLQTNNQSEQDPSLCLWIMDCGLITLCYDRKGTWSELAL